VIATILALSGFAVAIIAGLAAGNTPTRVLGAALACMLICHLVGLGVGAVGERVVNDYLDAHRAANPVDGKPGAPLNKSAATSAIRA
jgi:hypothetical protein